MAINPSPADLRMTVRFKPNFDVDTLAELQAIVDGDPATYENKYVRALDQPVGEQIYYVLGQEIVPAYNMDAYEAVELEDERTIYIGEDGNEVTGQIAVRYYSVNTTSQGIAAQFLTDNGLDGGSDIFSSILNVSASVIGQPGTIVNQWWVSGIVITGTHQASVRVVRANTVLLGGDSIRLAGAGVVTKIRVEGVLA